jgi:hypothetical protein
VTALRSLERFAKLARSRMTEGRCELCSATLEEQHRHVVDRTERRFLCACGDCAVALGDQERGRYRAVPDGVREDPSWTMTDRELEVLGVPVGLAFFVRASNVGRWTAFFPGPAGATEAEVDDAAWARVAAGSELVRSIEDDVEALLVRRERDGSCHAFVAPIDVCYELAGLLRSKWRGIDGGDEARSTLDGFFAGLGRRATTCGGGRGGAP